MVYVLSGRLINPGESPADIRRRELTARVNQPLLGCYKIAMLSLKGGVGKTTMTATLGATFASLRGDRVVAVDANPDRGTLSQKIPLETSATVRHLLRDAQRVRRYTDVRAYTSQGPSRLEVLASEQDPAVSEAFSEDDYRRTVNLLEHFYNIVLTDCGTGLMHSAMYGVLGVADQLVIVSSGSIDGARSASATMDWLDAHGHGDLVANSVAVINSVRRSPRRRRPGPGGRALRGALPRGRPHPVRRPPGGGRRDRSRPAGSRNPHRAAGARGRRGRRLPPRPRPLTRPHPTRSRPTHPNPRRVAVFARASPRFRASSVQSGDLFVHFEAMLKAFLQADDRTFVDDDCPLRAGEPVHVRLHRSRGVWFATLGSTSVHMWGPTDNSSRGSIRPGIEPLAIAPTRAAPACT